MGKKGDSSYVRSQRVHKRSCRVERGSGRDARTRRMRSRRKNASDGNRVGLQRARERVAQRVGSSRTLELMVGETK